MMLELKQADLQLVVRRLPVDVRDALRSNPGKLFVAGGFIRAVVGNEEVNDVDLFGQSTELLRRVAADMKASRDAKRLETKNAITLVAPDRLPLQFITRWVFDDADGVVASFDFSVCKATVFFEGGRFKSRIGADFYSDLAAKRLTYTAPVRDEEAGGSMLRVIKYVKRGYRIQMGDLGLVIGRIFANYDPARGHIGFDRYAVSRMQEVDPMSVIDGMPVDDDAPVEGLE